MPTSVLAFWTDVLPASEDDFEEWYNREHLPERVSVPGILNGSRYRVLQGRPKYFAMYEAADAGTLISAAYREKLDNPTPWTRRVMPTLRGATRGVFYRRRRLGRGHGAIVATIRFSPLPGRAADLEAWLQGDILDELVRRPRIVGAQVWQPHVEAMTLETTERRLRGDTDGIADWCLLLQGTGLPEVRAACRDGLSGATLQAHGTAPGMALGIYRLLYCLAP